MGTKCTPVCTTVMTFLVVKLYSKFQGNFSIEVRTKFKHKRMMCLDDCFIYRDTRVGPIAEVYSILSNLHENGKFTVDTNYKRMNFLEMQIIIPGAKIITDIYLKRIDTQNYVPFKSANANHMLRNIPYILARRLCTIPDENTSLNTRLTELEKT